MHSKFSFARQLVVFEGGWGGGYAFKYVLNYCPATAGAAECAEDMLQFQLQFHRARPSPQSPPAPAPIKLNCLIFCNCKQRVPRDMGAPGGTSNITKLSSLCDMKLFVCLFLSLRWYFLLPFRLPGNIHFCCLDFMLCSFIYRRLLANIHSCYLRLCSCLYLLRQLRSLLFSWSA